MISLKTIFKKISKSLPVILLILLILPLSANAMDIVSISGVDVFGDYVVGPGSYDLLLAPGDETVRNINITNRTGKVLKVKIEVEDFTGDPDVGTQLLGDERGPYSLKDFLKPDETDFRLSHGERAILPITIDIPDDAEPGGLYGSVLVKVEAENPQVEDPGSAAAGQVTINPRIAVLFFVRIKGEAKQEGKLTSFTSDKYFYQHGPVNFNLTYENTGRVHLTPYAVVEIYNLLGKKVDEISVPPWFVMPGITRNREVVWEKNLALGRYTAKIKLNRGYQDIVDQKEVNFWIIPTKILLIGLGVIIFISIILAWFSNKFEIKRK